MLQKSPIDMGVNNYQKIIITLLAWMKFKSILMLQLKGRVN